MRERERDRKKGGIMCVRRKEVPDVAIRSLTPLIPTSPLIRKSLVLRQSSEKLNIFIYEYYIAGLIQRK